MSRRVLELTGLRCVAVMLVVISHAEHMAKGGYTGLLAPLRYFANGGVGVFISFVLSGFLITELLQAEWRACGSIKLMRFYGRRALRIWPAFYVYLIALGLFGIAGLIDVDVRQILFAAVHLWNYSELLGLGNVNMAHPTGAWLLGHFWTLALDEQFYWLWPPVLLLLLRGRDPRWLVLVIMLMPLLRVLCYFATPSLRGQLGLMLHTGVDPVLMGCYIALDRERLKAQMNARFAGAFVLPALILVLLLGLPVIGTLAGGIWTATYGPVALAAAVGLLILAVVERPELWISRLLRSKAFVFVGTISFSLYVWQQLFTSTASPLALRFPFCILEALAAAALSYALVEAPFLRLRSWLGKRAQAATLEAGSEEGGAHPRSVEAEPLQDLPQQAL
ncbi:acyltransferase family protein [Cupriavidus sp. CuC1]|uniref:acyltransferase family protein n=1 Tax=Cupriavidus sp. CuC1 TaxID=3373131 RepID=UPI0037CFC4B7